MTVPPRGYSLFLNFLKKKYFHTTVPLGGYFTPGEHVVSLGHDSGAHANHRILSHCIFRIFRGSSNGLFFQFDSKGAPLFAVRRLAAPKGKTRQKKRKRRRALRKTRKSVIGHTRCVAFQTAHVPMLRSSSRTLLMIPPSPTRKAPPHDVPTWSSFHFHFFFRTTNARCQKRGPEALHLRSSFSSCLFVRFVGGSKRPCFWNAERHARAPR